MGIDDERKGSMVRKLSVAIGLCAMALCLAGPAWAEANDEGFVPLLNGKDLTGWEGDPDLWTVEDGVIVGSTHDKKIEHNTFLISEKEYGDFTLRLKVKLENHNSGIQFRSEVHPDYVVSGYQADVAEQTYFGMLYEEKLRGIMPYWNAMTDEERAAVFAAAKPHDWNDYEIICKGDLIQMKLNGKLVCDIVDPDGAKKGVIAFQLHAGDPMRVYFKDIMIKEDAPADS